MGLANVWFRIGEVSALPFAAGSFSIVTSRYAFHHFPEPARALKEMLRVGRPGARIAVMDMVASDDPARAARFNRMETLRDPSHVAALTLPALRQLFLDAGLPEPSIAHHQMQVELGAVMSASFPDPGDALRVRDMIVASIADDAMGVRTRVEGDKTLFSYPITLLVSAIPR